MATESGVERRARLDREMRERAEQMAGRKPRVPVDPLDEILEPEREGGLEAALDEAREEKRGRLIKQARWVLRHQVGDDPFPEATLMKIVGPELSELDAQQIVRELQRESRKE